MSSRVIEWRRERAKLLADARSLNDKVQGENRDFTSEEQTNWDKMLADAEKLHRNIEREERMAVLEDRNADPDRPLFADHRAGDPNMQPGDQVSTPNDKRMRNVDYRGHYRSGAAYQRAFVSFLNGGLRSLQGEESRALQAGVDASGGYTLAPLQMVDALLMAVDNQVYIRDRATKYLLESPAALGVPTLTADPSDADWTTELATGSEDNAMAFGRRSLSAWPLAKRIKVSNLLLRKNPKIDGLVTERLAYKFAVTHEKAMMTGDGVNKPLGIFVASNNGIPAARDYATGNTATSVTFDGLIGAKYTLKGQYLRKAEWMFHRDVMRQLALIKDNQGQYIWRESVRAGEPDQVLGLPVMISEFAPNTLATGLYAGILGDFSYYWVVDSLDYQVQRLVELYAETNQTGFIGRLETDGAPVMGDAFVRVKLA